MLNSIKTINKDFRFMGGDRGGHYNKWLCENFQVDHNAFGGKWIVQDRCVPVILHESIAVLGTQFHELCSKLKVTPVYTYAQSLNTIGPFRTLPYPFDFNVICPLRHGFPYERINQLFYNFGRKQSYQAASGMMLKRVAWENLYGMRYILSELDEVATPDIGPSLDDKLEVMHQYRYAIACENCVCKGYVTEKLFDAILADVIPVYWGGELPQWLENAVIRTRPTQEGINKVLQISESEYMEKLDNVRAAQKILPESQYSWEYAYKELEKYASTRL